MDAGDFDGVGELFAAGVLLDPDGNEIARGREAVASFYRRIVILYDGSPRTEHVTADAEIQIHDENAAVTSTYVVHQQIDGHRARVAAGRYADRFRRIAGRWRFAQRQFFLDEAHEMSNHVRMPQSD